MKLNGHLIPVKNESNWSVKDQMKVIDCELFWKVIGETGLTVTQLSKDFQISRSTLYNISSGQTCPSTQVISNIANAVKMTEKDFVTIFFPNIKFEKEL